MPYAEVVPVINRTMRALCQRPYPRHPKGCPNWNKKHGCPPDVPLLGEVYDLKCGAIAVWNVFDLCIHVERMREKHPEWSKAQLECCLYWQGTARKQLQYELDRALMPGTVAEKCPEALGVNVTETMQQVGVRLEWPPVEKTVQVALLLYPMRS